MLELSAKKNPKIDVEDIAVESKIKLHAVDTFKLIKQKYNGDDIFFIMGSDNFRKMPEWKNYEELINNYNIIVIERERKKVRHYENFENIKGFIPEKLAEVNSTKIRQMIKNNEEEAKKYLNENVYEYIRKNELYM